MSCECENRTQRNWRSALVTAPGANQSILDTNAGSGNGKSFARIRILSGSTATVVADILALGIRINNSSDIRPFISPPNAVAEFWFDVEPGARIEVLARVASASTHWIQVHPDG